MNEQAVPQKKGMGKGCKIALIIFGILALLVIVAVVLSYVYCSNIQNALIEKGVNAVEEMVVTDLPEGFDEQDVKATFREFKAALKAGALGREENSKRVQKLANEFQYAMSDEKIDAKELKRILDMMKQIISE